jgi:hypothetical protein
MQTIVYIFKVHYSITTKIQANFALGIVMQFWLSVVQVAL